MRFYASCWPWVPSGSAASPRGAGAGAPGVCGTGRQCACESGSLPFAPSLSPHAPPLPSRPFFFAKFGGKNASTDLLPPRLLLPAKPLQISPSSANRRSGRTPLLECADLATKSPAKTPLAPACKSHWASDRTRSPSSSIQRAGNRKQGRRESSCQSKGKSSRAKASRGAPFASFVCCSQMTNRSLRLSTQFI